MPRPLAAYPARAGRVGACLGGAILVATYVPSGGAAPGISS
ncbi:hypothetical protein [Sorangium sp. So ce1097]